MQTVLTIAGTDPTGGAGVQADLKTFTAHRVYGMSIITALVAQNTMGVRDIMNVPPHFLQEQFSCVFEDIVPDAIKIGMVSETSLIDTIVEQLQFYQAQRIVVDPVMVATSGSSLLQEDALQALKERLIPLASIITPNLSEAQILADCEIHTKEDMIKAAENIRTWYDGTILIKGGHWQNHADDLLMVTDEIIWLNGKHIENPNTHGTGCTLSSAIAANLAMGSDIMTSVKHAKAYVSGALRANLDLGKGSGPLNHCWEMLDPFID